MSTFTTFQQIVDVTGYKATGLTALAVWYTRNETGDTTSSSKVTLTALDADDVAIGGSTSSSNIIAPTTTWKRAELTKVLPAGTVKVKYVVTLNNETAFCRVDGISLHIGQMSSELVANGSFTNGTFTSWTNVTNSFVANTTKEYASDGATLRSAQGGAFASSEIKQEIAVPAGYEYGDAVLTFARGNDFADNGTVTLEVLNGGGSVIASATTGAEAIASGWERRRLIVTLPDGAATLRVRLIAARALGSGNSGALFDDVSLRIHKDLDPAFERVLDFTAPARAVMPRSWEEAYLAWWPVAIPWVWNGTDLIPSVRPGQRNGFAAAAWTDASTPAPAKFLGHWTHDEDANSVDAYRFERSGPHVEIDGYGQFAKADTFSVAVCFRVTERAMTLACGLVGDRDATDVGWGMTIDTSGRAVAGLTGSAPRTATGTVDHRDGAAHWVLMTWNGTTLRVVDSAGTATNASDPGEFEVDELMRIGSDGVLGTVGGVDIARVLVWDGVAISQADFQGVIDTIGDDPNGLTAWTSSNPVWSDGEADADGATLVRAAASHVPVTYRSGYALSTGTACTNLIQSTDYPAGPSISIDADVTLTHDIVDPTGMARGVRVVSTDVGVGILLEDLPLGLVAGTLHVVAWMRANPAQQVTIHVLDSADNPIGSDEVSVTALWQRFEVAISWTGATATGYLRFAVDDTVSASFDLGSVVYAALGVTPTAYPDADVALGDRHGVVTETLPLQLHREGEIEVEAQVNTDATGGYVLACVDNGVDAKNQRIVGVDSGGVVNRPFVSLFDNAGSAVANANATGTDWSATRTLRGRWNRLELPESLTNQLAIAESDVIEGSAASAFSLSTTTPSEKIRLGGGGIGGTTSPHALLRRVVVRAREGKLL